MKQALLPRPDHVVLRLLIDEGVSNAVGRAFQQRGHEVIFGNRSLARGSPDQLVCTAALNEGAILVAADHDMRAIARANGVGTKRFKSLSLIKLTCRSPEAATKVTQAMSLIEHEWQCRTDSRKRGLWMEIQASVIKIYREVT